MENKFRLGYIFGQMLAKQAMMGGAITPSPLVKRAPIGKRKKK